MLTSICSGASKLPEMAKMAGESRKTGTLQPLQFQLSTPQPLFVSRWFDQTYASAPGWYHGSSLRQPS